MKYDAPKGFKFLSTILTSTDGTTFLRSAGFGVSKSHHIAWKFAFLLTPYSPETLAAQSRGLL